jgi:hypothetical protein
MSRDGVGFVKEICAMAGRLVLAIDDLCRDAGFPALEPRRLCVSLGAVNTSATLLRSASRRIQLAAFGRRFHGAGLVLAGIALLGLIAARLLSLLPQHWLTPVTLGALPILALFVALFLTRKPAPAHVARTVDARAGSKELFLTATLMGEAPAEFRGLVHEEAENRAAKLNAARLLPMHWLPGARNLVIAFAALYAAALWLPRFDPFQFEEKRAAVVKQEQRLIETKKITAVRKEELAEKGEVFNAQVEQALAKLDKTLKEAKPEQRELNAKRLNEEAQDFSELWKKASAQLPKEALEKAAQQFGDQEERREMKELLDKLKQGDPAAIKQAMEKLQQEMEKISQMPEGGDKQKQLDQLAKEVGKMAAQLRDQLGDKNVNDALSRALEQMDLAKNKDLAKQALDAANESMKLSQEELEKMGEMFKDMQNIEDALKNLQAAKQLNEKGQLDGKDAQQAGAKTPEEYEKLYKDLMAKAGEQGDGEGDGDGNGKPGRGKSGNQPGIGKGGTVGEDPNAKTGLKTEKSNAQLGAGKLLMQWKEEGVGETGQKSADYQEAVRAVKQGVAEAIRSEQVPPGYHGAIQKYFDRLPEKPAGR